MVTSIENLAPNASASDMEQAIKEAERQQTNPINPVSEKKIEVVEEVKEPVKEEAKIEVKEPVKKEAVEEFDYKKAYDGLRSWQTKMAQEVAESKRALDEFRASGKPKQPENQQATLSQEQFLEWQDKDPISANRWLAQVEASNAINPYAQRIKGLEQALTGILGQSIINQYRTQYSDFTTLEDEIREEVLRFPPEIQDNPTNYSKVLENSYWAVKGRKLKDVEESAREQGRKEAIVKAQAKKDAYVEGASTPTSQTSENFDTMSSKDLFELLKARGAVKN